jgi:signal transduction histidine kinase
MLGRVPAPTLDGATNQAGDTPGDREDVVVATQRLADTYRDLSPGGRSQPDARWLRRVTLPAGIALSCLATVGSCIAMTRKSPPAMAAAAPTLVVALAGIFWLLASRSTSEARSLAVVTMVGLAGATLCGLLPGTPAFLIVCLALTSLGIRLPLVNALTAGLVVYTTLNLANVVSGRVSVSTAISQDVAAAFVFAIGAFARSARVAQERSMAAQACAEDLLEQLRASQGAQAEAATLAERARLAREIHDILAHALSGLVLALDTAQLLGRRAEADPETLARLLEHVARAQRIARDGLTDTRRAIAALRGDELPGPALLDRLVAETAATADIRIALTVTGQERPLPPEIGLALYRTAQEALTNTVKYAGRGGRAQLRLCYRDHDVELAIEDTRSDDAEPPGPAGLTFGGYGLTGMRERAELLGGQLTAGPTGTGFQVLLRLPASPQPEPAAPAAPA